jgi:hypothetical protein
MADLSLNEMLYYILEYSSEGMTLAEIQAELGRQFSWDGPPEQLEHELEARPEFCRTGDGWKANPD